MRNRFFMMVNSGGVRGSLQLSIGLQELLHTCHIL